MSMHERMESGIYLDETTGDIWRKSQNGDWTINGQVWTPFPKAIRTLHTFMSAPAVSIADAVQDEWRVIPTFENYEVNVRGDIRIREVPENEINLNPYITMSNNAYLLFDNEGSEHWVSRVTAYNKAFPYHGQQ
jgi:hypothetical protein